MKLKGLEANTKTGKVKEVFEEIPDEEYRKREKEAKKAEGKRKERERISAKKEEILERMAREELGIK